MRHHPRAESALKLNRARLPGKRSVPHHSKFRLIKLDEAATHRLSDRMLDRRARAKRLGGWLHVVRFIRRRERREPRKVEAVTGPLRVNHSLITRFRVRDCQAIDGA